MKQKMKCCRYTIFKGLDLIALTINQEECPSDYELN